MISPKISMVRKLVLAIAKNPTNLENDYLGKAWKTINSNMT
jgi:hypothetical protein